MPGYVIGNFFIYAMINAFTPGPGNILALNTTVNSGWKKGKPLFLGIFVGYYTVQLICAVFVYSVNTFLPAALSIMKYIGALYIVLLAIQIAFSSTKENASKQRVSFSKGFILQFVNVKIYLFGITALTGYVTDYMASLHELVFFELIIATIGTVATCAWILMGVAIQNWYTKYRKPINIVLAIMLLECAYSILK